MKIFSPVEIKKLIFGGYGLGWAEGKTLFVEKVLAGEVVSARQTGKTGNAVIAEPVDIITPSPDRREPECSFFHECGGCGWLHMSYPAQVREKKNILIESLQRIGKIEVNKEIETFSSPEWEYRIRAQFKVDHQHKKIGFFRQNSHQVVDISHCPLLNPALNSMLKEKQTIFSRLSPGDTIVKAIVGADGDIASFPMLDTLTQFSTSIRVDSLTFKVSGASFFQGNTYLHHLLGTWPGKWASQPNCIDMYGGTGFFSCLSGDRFQKGLLVEQDKDMCALAQENFKQNEREHFRILRESVDTITRESLPFPMNKTTVIVDPPRTGLSKKLIRTLISLRPEQIISVSCDPSTQARDVGMLVTQGGYKVSHIALFDCFPNTYHIENGVVLHQ